jgi:hypothetical protein
MHDNTWEEQDDPALIKRYAKGKDSKVGQPFCRIVPLKERPE